MKIEEFEIELYKLPTSLGFVREGIIITLTDDLGRVRKGEIAPLPGRSHETLLDALAVTKKVRERFLRGDFSLPFFPPSVVFGIDMTLASNEDLPFKVYSNKLKIRNLSLSEAVDLCKKQNGPFRIDLNRSWPLEKTVEFCKQFKAGDFLYLEDPVSNFTDLEKFYDQTGFHYAVDEFLALHPLERIANLRGLTHLIIKPTLFGGIEECRNIVNETRHLCHIFSSAYETSLGLNRIAQIGASLSPSEAVGIATGHIFNG